MPDAVDVEEMILKIYIRWRCMVEDGDLLLFQHVRIVEFYGWKFKWIFEILTEANFEF